MHAARARAVARRLNALELASLRERVELQHAELERLRDALTQAEVAADSWRESYFDELQRSVEDGKGTLAMTKDGHFGLIPTGGAVCAG